MPSGVRGQAAFQWMALLAFVQGCSADAEWTWHAPSDGYAFSMGLARGPGERLYVSQLELNGRHGVLTTLETDGTEVSDRRFVATDGQVRFHALAVDESGSVQIAGEFEGTLSFGPGEVRTSTSCSNEFLLGCSDAFVASYEADGALRWVRVYAEEGNDRAVAIDSHEGRTVLVGVLRGQDSSPPPDDFIQEDLKTVFVAALDDTGDELWTIQYEAERGHAEVGDVAMDAEGSLWFSSGYWRYVESRSVFFPFLTQVSAGGAEMQRLDAPLGSLARGPDGDMFLAGWFRDSVALGNEVFESSGETDIIIARFEPNSGSIRWSRQLGGSHTDEVSDVAIDPAGDVLIAGRTFGSILVGGDEIVGVPGDAGSLVAKLHGLDGRAVGAGKVGVIGAGATHQLVALGIDDVVVAAATFYTNPAAVNEPFVRRFDPFADE